MSYPNPPNFGSASDDDAWWIISTPDGSSIFAICTVGPKSFIDLIQTITGTTQTGVWDQTTLNSLLASLRGAGASSALVGAVSTDLAANQVSRDTIRAAVWLMHRGQSFGGNVPVSVDESRIGIAPSTILPPWGVEIPDGPSGDSLPACYAPNAVPAATPPPAPQPPTPGMPVPPPPGKPVIMPGQVSPVPPAQAGMGAGTVLGIVAVAAAVIGGIYVAGAKLRAPAASPRSRRNPAPEIGLYGVPIGWYGVWYDLQFDGHGGTLPKGWSGGTGQSAGYTVAAFPTREEADEFASVTTIHGRRHGQRGGSRVWRSERTEL